MLLYKKKWCSIGDDVYAIIILTKSFIRGCMQVVALKLDGIHDDPVKKSCLGLVYI